MIKAWLHGLFLSMLAVGGVRAQTPTGTIAGVVTDATGAALSGARVEIINRDTGQSRSLTTLPDGGYVAAALPSGLYRVSVEAAAFKRLEREASVEAGTTTTVDVVLEVGDVTERVTVGGTLPVIQRDDHQIGGVVTRDQIDRLPLNGRNFLELAKLEPGVTNPARLNDGRVFVSALGGGLQTIPRIGSTRVTVDGGSISTPGTVGVLLQVSQDVVQEFQIATVNFDPTSSLTSNGAINIVTRSGGNAFRGSGSYFHRDSNLAAYPALRRDPLNSDPSFERHQFGSYFGGPVQRDRTFFFGSYERTDQTGVVSIQPVDEFAPLGGIFPTPYVGNQFNVRGDVQLGVNHNAFGRYTRDGNRTFANLGPPSLPSGWQRRVNNSNQAIGGLTSVISSRFVNDVRWSYFSIDVPITAATADDCGNCFGLGLTRTTVQNAGIAFGTASSSLNLGHRFQLSDNIVWHRGSHTVRAGFDWEHSKAQGFVFGAPGGEITVYAPSFVRQTAPAIPLPASFTTVEDILMLPLRTVSLTVGPGTILWPGFSDSRKTDLYRLYFGDTWRLGSRLTLNYGLGWSYEPNALTHDLTKPALLTPILGIDGLRPPVAQKDNFSPMVGFAWSATSDGRTVVRGGVGRYFDPANSTNAVNLINERHLLSPLGTGNLTRAGSNLIYQGRPLEFLRPTPFTGAQAVDALPEVRAELLHTLNPDNRDFSVRNLDGVKEGQNLYDPSYSTPYGIHAGVGVQREVARNVTLSADVVWKRFRRTYINGIDYNRFNSARGPILPRCSDAQRQDVHAVCSNGPIYFDTTTGRARYVGMLLRLEKRFSRGTQFLASYALGSFVGTNGTGVGTSEAPGGRVFGFNNDNWLENYGPLPTDQRHIFNFSGFIELPWRLQVGVSVSAYSATPVSPFVANADFNGDGTISDLLPGTTVNQFGGDLDEDDLRRLVSSYNQQYADRPAGNIPAPRVTLPEDYSFNDNFFTQDVRLSRTFSPDLGSLQASVFVEVFNLLNTPNLVGFGSNLAAPESFGQPAQRFNQVFGSGGPRAFQLGARLSF
jgi:hypothetical protein